jgi:uncharacterized protein GlcG (DUF336 family)
VLQSRFGLVLAVAAMLLPATASSAPAQGLITQKMISLDMARTIAEGVIEQCRADGFSVSVTVIDSSGMVKAFLRDDGTGPHTIDLSRRKAYTALTFANRWASTGAAAADWGTTLMSPMPNVDGTTGVGGGVPIKADGKAVGAVGVSGAVGWQGDEACAKAGIAKVADQLK